jgi:predicted extracellular nuclease
MALAALPIGPAPAAHAAGGGIVINEIDYDQPSTDTAEFIELKNTGSAAVSLSGYTLKLFNGASTVSAVYDTIALPNVSLAAGDYFVICANAATVTNCDLDDSPDTNFIQNGAPDAVGLWNGDVLVDAVSYAGNSAAPYIETSGVGLVDSSSVPNVGISRYPDGTDTDVNNVDFSLRCISPGLANVAAVSGCGVPPISREIFQVQGAGHTSPHTGANVSLTGNIVTAVARNGFYLQTPDARADADVATSNGIFVFTSSRPTVAVGDQVDVTGLVTEFLPGAAATNLTFTEITGPAVTITSSGNPLPAATVIGAGGRVPPTSVIEDDGLTVFDAVNDGIDFYESLEGMFVQVNNAVVVGPTNRFGEIWLAPDGGALGGTYSPRGGLVISATDYNPERIQIDDDMRPSGFTWPQLSVGTDITSPVQGVVSYNFGNFEVLVTQTFTYDASGAVTPEVTALAAEPGTLTVATFNVLNLDPEPTADGNDNFAGLANIIANHMLAPDIVILEEVQDNSGAKNGAADPTVAADVTYNTLIAAVQAAGGPAYAYAQVDPLHNQDGGEPGGNIRVGFLYNPARVTFVPAPAGDATTANAVACSAGAPSLTLNPGRIDPNNAAFFDSRKPVAAQFEFDGHTFFVIGNHLNSKSGDTPLFGLPQPPNLVSEVQRLQQVAVINGFVQSILDCDPTANVIVGGDLNDFHFSAPVVALKGSTLTDLIDTLPAGEQYTYIFEGNSQVLDHLLVTTHSLATWIAEVDVVHADAEFHVTAQVSDHDPVVARFTPTFDLAIDKAGPENAFQGDLALFTYVVTNPGPASATPVVSDDTCAPVVYVSGDDSSGMVDPGEQWLYACVGTITADPGTVVANTATVTGGAWLGGDRSLANNTDTWSVTVWQPDAMWYGCGPGYWKGRNAMWPAPYLPSQAVASVFASPYYGSTSLADALKLRGGDDLDGAAQILLRAGVAGLLSEAQLGAGYPAYTSTDHLVLGVNAALNLGDRDLMLWLAASLDRWNNGMCQP